MREEKSLSQRAFSIYTNIRKLQDKAKTSYLMQFQSDILGGNVLVPDAEELSGIGVAYAAGIAMGIYTMDLFKLMKRKTYSKEMDENLREKKYTGWSKAVRNLV